MRFPDFNVPTNTPTPAKPSALGHILPSDPKAPERPTIPPPTCGTLPPSNPLLDLLGTIGKLGK